MTNSEEKLKIILVNYRFFISGGPERYMFNIKSLLEENGHTVIPFSVKHNKNEPSKYEKYFLTSVGEGDETYFGEYKKNVKTIIKTFSRMFYSFEAKKKISLLIENEKPDLIYIIHFQNKISASIIDAAFNKKVPIIQRISDFGHICANSNFFLPTEKKVCEKCLHGNIFNSVKYKCVYNSYIYSFLKSASLLLQRRLAIYKKIDCFVFPSMFTLKKYRQFGIDETKLFHIPTFFNNNLIKNNAICYNEYALYVGRIEPEKGIKTMMDAFIDTPYKLKIIGFSNANYELYLKDYLSDKNHYIEFLGQLEFIEIQNYLSSCLFTIVPSELYDNFPNTILESFAFSKPVIASNIGSLPELVSHNTTGLLFEAGNSIDLKNCCKYLFGNISKVEEMGKECKTLIQSKFSSKEHYAKLLQLFYKST